MARVLTKEKIMKKWLALLLTSCLVGCSTTTVPMQEAVYEKPFFNSEKTEENNVKVTVVRDGSAYVGSILSFYIQLDGKEIADLMPKEKTTFYTTEGKHLISVRLFNGEGPACFLDLKKGESVEVRCGVLYSDPFIRRAK